jgi:predicted alpha/beta-hydrolase family hydrolase
MTQHMSKIKVESRFGVTLWNTFIHHEPAVNRLMVILPGKGYTCDFPLLHFTRAIGLQHGYNVLSLKYGFQVGDGEFSFEQTPFLLDDATQAIDQVLKRGYTHLCVVGKSLGTPLAAQIVRDTTIDKTCLILLTPLGGALQGLDDKIPTLVMIGTADPLYSPDVVGAFDGFANIRWRIFDDLNHSLEVAQDWQASLNVLSPIMGAIEHFLLER